MSILNKIYLVLTIVILLLLLSFGIYFYIENTNLKEQLLEKNKKITVLSQNVSALEYQSETKDSIIKDYSIFVTNLKNTIDEKNNKYNVLYSKYKILLDSVNVVNKPTNSDSSNGIIKVYFAGNKGKIHYNGETVYFTTTDSSVYSINIVQDKITIETKLYYDKNTKLFKNYVYADSLLITDAISKIDSTVFLLLSELENCNKLEEKGIFEKINVFLEINQEIIKDNSIYKADQFSLRAGFNYTFNNNTQIYCSKEILNNGYNIGIRFSKNIKELFNILF